MPDSTPAPRFIRGHGLVREGWAHDAAGNLRDSRNEPGYAKCACGLLRGPFPNTAQRKRWHAVHKASVLAGGQDPAAIECICRCDDCGDWINECACEDLEFEHECYCGAVP